MTVQLQDFKIDPREYDIFAGLDVDKRRMTTTFTDHGTLSRSLSFPYSSQQLLNYVGKHFRGQKWPSFMRPDRPVLVSTMI